MFGKKSHAEVKKAPSKVLDTKRDSATRLKHLRTIIDTYELPELLTFFEQNYSHIYFIYFDCLCNVELELRQRASKQHKEELDYILQLLEKILLYLPNLIHRKWQYHSIGRTMRKLLHPANSIKIQQEGMRLFLIWYQVLQDAAADDCHELFASLVPRLAGRDDIEALCLREVQEAAGAVAQPEQITALLAAQQGDKTPDNAVTFALSILLHFMVSEVNKVCWPDKGAVERSFQFLFGKFKQFYLLKIFPGFRDDLSIYDPQLALPQRRSLDKVDMVDAGGTGPCRDLFVKWLASFVMVDGGDKKKDEPATASVDKTDTGRSMVDGFAYGRDMEPVTGEPRSNNSTMSTGSSLTERESTDSAGADEVAPADRDIVTRVLLSSTHNINLLHEVFHQTFLLSSQHGTAVKKVISVYRGWFQCSVEQRPMFMRVRDEEEANVTPPPSATSTSSAARFTSPAERTPTFFVTMSSPTSTALNTTSSSLSAYDPSLVAGLQNVLQVFITHSANVFLLDIGDQISHLDEQVDLCKRTLNIYRIIVMSHLLEQRTWEQLLMVLLRVVLVVMPTEVPARRADCLAGRLAQPLFQTLAVTWIKASLNVVVSAELWDQLTNVLSSLTGWVELIREWAKTMESLTRVLAKQVYNIDVKDLPLQRQSEQKEKKLRGMKPNGGYDMMRDDSSQSQTQRLVRKMSDAGGRETRQRYHSGDVPPVMSASTQHLPTATGLLSTFTTTSLQLPRSNSDSSLMVDPESKGIDDSAPLSGDRTSGQGEGDDCSSGDESLDSSSEADQHIPYVDIEAGAGPLYRNGSDTEMLLRVSDTDVSKVSSEKMDTSDMHVNGGQGQSGDTSMEDVPRQRAHTYSPATNGGHRGSVESSTDVSRLHLTLHNGATTDDNNKANESNSFERQSLIIDDVDGLHNAGMLGLEEGASEDYRSILAGGCLAGWTPDSSVILWRRMLGSLGDLNCITDPEIHAEVYEYLCDLTDCFIKVRDNMCISHDKENSPPPPEYVPPLEIISPWLFTAVELPDKYKRGRLLAHRLLCSITVRRADIAQSGDHLMRFYRVLHTALTSHDRECISEILRQAGTRYFSLSLPGAALLTLDFVQACKTLLESTDTKSTVSRCDAVSVAASLLCYANHFGTLPVLAAHIATPTVIDCENLKDLLVDVLIRTCKKESDSKARSLCVCALMVYLYEELTHHTNHARIHDAIGCLLAMLMCTEKRVAMLAADGLLLLSEHISTLLNEHRTIATTIVETAIGAASSLLALRPSSTEGDKKLVISILFVVLEWSMRLPQSLLLLRSLDDYMTLLERVFKLFNDAAMGSNEMSQSASQLSYQHFWSLVGTLTSVEDIVGVSSELSGARSAPSVKFDQSAVPLRSGHRSADAHKTHESHKSDSAITGRSSLGDVQRNSALAEHSSSYSYTDSPSVSVEVAARTALSHIVNQLGHYPSFWGSARLTSIVQEVDDITADLELKPADLLMSPHVQYFVYNNSTLISLVEIPLPNDLVGGVTMGLTVGQRVTRLIVRDAAGKSCWDCSMLYGPPKCRAGSYPAAPRLSLFPIPEDLDLVGQETEVASVPGTDIDSVIDEDMGNIVPVPALHNWKLGGPDNLDRLLEYVGSVSAECLVHPDKALNVPFHVPDEVLPAKVEQSVRKLLSVEHVEEMDYVTRTSADINSSLMADAIEPPDTRDANMDFHLCRHLVNQLGFLSWQKRAQFDLLRKSDKLMRDLKHLDNAVQCRETYKIAVFYVAEGQEDRQSILTNKAGSRAYENFVSGLGWEVDLDCHAGFMGGVDGGKKSGESAPYCATSTREVFFHVSTRMPSTTDEEKHRKLRHLGNDEVHIVWSEHTRDYRRGIIPTDFGDVLIVIYPLNTGFFRIHIDRKPEVPVFGPLFDGCIVDASVLPGLVRATAINANNALRSFKMGYLPFYEQRARYIRDVVNHSKDETIYEDFAAQIFAPVLPKVARFAASVDVVDYRMPQTRGTFVTDSVPSSGPLVDPGIIGNPRGQDTPPDRNSVTSGQKTVGKESEAGSGLGRRFSFKKKSRLSVVNQPQVVSVNNNTLPYTNKSPTLGAKSKKV